MLKLTVDAERLKDKSVIIIKLSGTLNVQNLASAEERWYQEIENGPKMLAINLYDLDFIDSSALGALVKLLNKATERDISLIIYEINPTIQIMFDTVKLGKFFTILKKEEFEAEYGGSDN